MDNFKYCVNCKQWQDISKFHKNKSTKDGLSNWCKNCNNSYTKVKYLNNIESERERCRKSSTKYRETHREKIMQQRELAKEYQKEYREKNKDKLQEVGT
jgi:predicted sulfurtransferase